MERLISGYHQDDEGDWVSELNCGHNQHVRHRPPFQPRPWILDSESRRSHLGTMLDCPLCERAELPAGLRFVRLSPQWDEQSTPPVLLRDHRIASGTWGRLVVYDGKLRFRVATTPVLDEVVHAGQVQPIPPALEHHIELIAPVRFSIEFLTVDRGPVDSTAIESSATETSYAEMGGDAACWAHLVSDEFGTIGDQDKGPWQGPPQATTTNRIA